VSNIQLAALTAKLKDLASQSEKLTSWLKGSALSAGLDIGSHSVKGLLLRRLGDVSTLLNMVEQPLPAGAQSSDCAQAIQQVLAKLNAQEARVVAAVGGSGVVLRSIVLPKMAPQELRASLSFEAEKHIPFKMDQTFLDFSIVGARPDGRMEILLAAARKEVVEDRMALLQVAQVSPLAIDLEMVALANAWEMAGTDAQGDQVSVLIHVGARGTIFNFLKGKQVQFTRETGVGGDAFTQAVSEGLHLDSAQAETLKCAPGERVQEVRNALQPAWEEWLNQCRVSFDFYENQFGQEVSRLCLSGGSARLGSFVSWVGEETGLPTTAWNPLKGLTSEVDAAHIEQAGVSMGVALGLAVRGAM